MHRDPTRRKRNALAIPGVLLILLSLVGILYAQTIRSDNVECEDGSLVVLAGACRSAALMLVIPLALGVVLVILAARSRGRETCYLGHGTVATTTLAVLIAATLLPALVAIGLYLSQDPTDPYVFLYGETEYAQATLMGAVAVLAGLVLVPFLILYIATGSPPRCCSEKGCFEPCFCDEAAAAPPIPPFPADVSVATVTDNAQVTTSSWTGPAPVPAEQAPGAPVAPAPMLPYEPPATPAPPVQRETSTAAAAPASASTVWDVDETTPAKTDAKPSKTAAKGKRKVTRKKSEK